MSTPQSIVSSAKLFASDGSEAPATGELSIRQVVPVASIGEDDLLALVARARWPEHAPIAQALATAVKERVSPASHRTPQTLQDDRDPDSRWDLIPARGITGCVGGFELLIGTRRLVEDAGIVITEGVGRVLAEHERQGWTSILAGACRRGPAPHEQHRSLIGILAWGPKAEASAPTCPATRSNTSRTTIPERTRGRAGWVTKLRHRLSAICTGVRARRWRWAVVLICASGLAGTLLSLVAVAPDEAVIVQRFGRAVAYCGPGLHVRPLWAIETPIRIQPHRVRTVQIGLPPGEPVLTGDAYAPIGPQTQPASNRSPHSMPESASQLLRVDARVQYAISDLHAFMFGSRDPDALVAISAESVLRELIGTRSMIASLGPQRGELATRGKQRLQNRLDALGCGVSIRTIVLDHLQPAPGTAALDVAEAFNEVTRADAQRAEAIAQAQAECDHLIGQARTRADQIQAAARAEQVRDIEAAQARAEWVQAHHAAFRRAPEQMRRQMLIDLISESASGRTVIVDPTLNEAVRLLLQIGEPGRSLSLEALEDHGLSEPTAPKGGRP